MMAGRTSMAFLAVIVLALAFSSCKSQYELLLNSTDADLKYEKAFGPINLPGGGNGGRTATPFGAPEGNA